MPMVDIDWLKEHVEVPSDLTYEQLAKDLVRVGLEEEEISRLPGHRSDRRRICRRRDAGTAEERQDHQLVSCRRRPRVQRGRRERQEGAAWHHLRRPEHGRRREGRRDLAGCSAARRFQDRTAQDLRPRFRWHVRLGARARPGRQPRRHHPAARLRLHAPRNTRRSSPATTRCTCCTSTSRSWKSTSLRIAATRSHTVACLANTIIPPARSSSIR